MAETDFRYWPALLRQVAEIAGVPAALRLAASHGGQQLSVPARAEGSALARESGMPAAEALVALRGGETAVAVPSFHARLAIERRRHVLTHPGRSANHLARELGISYRRVQQIRAEAAGDPRQIALDF